MINSIYPYSISIALGVIAFIGIFLVFGNIPQRLKNTTYSLSRKITGFAFLILSLELLSFTIFNLRASNINIAIATNLTTYYIIGNLFSLAFNILLQRKVNLNSKNLLFKLIHSFLYIAILWIVVTTCQQRVINVYLIFAVAYFLSTSAYFLYQYLKSYKIAKERADDYFSESIDEIIEWTKYGQYYMVLLIILAVIMIFLPKWPIAIFMLLEFNL